MHLIEFWKSYQDIEINKDQEEVLNSLYNKLIKYSNIPIHSEELRQYCYCKRVLYWRRVANFKARQMPLMVVGSEYHEMSKKRKYNYKGDIKDLKDKYFYDNTLGIGARIDNLRVMENEIIPIEIKRFGKEGIKPYHSHIYQVVLAGIAAEQKLRIPFWQIEFRYWHGVKTILDVDLSLKTKTLEIILEAREMIRLQTLPSPDPNKNKCTNCEYWNVCFRI